MHEMGITREVLDAVRRAAEEAGAVRVTAVQLKVGELTDVVPDALLFAWEALTPGTVAEGARLEVEHVPARSRCGECGNEFAHDRFDRRCPACGSFLVTVLSGSELQVEGADVDLPEDVASNAGRGSGTGG